MLCYGLDAAAKLAEEGILAKVVDMHTIKPLDVDAVKDCVENIGKIIIIEDHNISRSYEEEKIRAHC